MLIPFCPQAWFERHWLLLLDSLLNGFHVRLAFDSGLDSFEVTRVTGKQLIELEDSSATHEVLVAVQV
jgi:hypothetical protein